MNPQHAVFVTLLVAAVSGVAIWQRDAAAAPKVSPAVAPAPVTATAAREVAWSRWFDAAIACWHARELTVDLRRSENTLTLQLSWRRAPAAADRAVADGSR